MPATRIEPDEALSRVRNALGDLASEVQLNLRDVAVTTTTENLVEVMKKLRDEPDVACKYFTFLSGIDWSEFPDAPAGLEVFVHVQSPEHGIRVHVHAPIDLEDPQCPTLTGLFGGALWAERETWELLGIHFEGHPALAPLYLPEDFEGHPLLKSFKLPSRMVKDWPGAKDPEEAAGGGR